jgi:membrane protein
MSAYGAAGSVVIILAWIYYSAQILYFGAEFTHVYSSECGSQWNASERRLNPSDRRASRAERRVIHSGGREFAAG